ncbi:putative lipase 2 precursor [Aspergillus steynii IBT 23096]|uniref:Putative lipase 2 n=1 Tax=Aspergillus steynii IBT 23096 TaxID=1392250 RepID=A0A2I2FWP6_9EURO|nr:putative lipase 2 precursor [Aspergillus steynii IBT 23096]PLB44986.1 putative lipase 2 precursor [Aspergillus steynii IBT 23096]
MRTLYILGFIASHISLAVSQSAVPPSQDSWYTQPYDIDQYYPGQMIRTRQVSNRLQSLLALPVDVSVETVHQYMYRTTDSLDNPVAAVTTLMVPFDSDPTKLLAYQTAYDTSNADCSPSYALRYRSFLDGTTSLLNSTAPSDMPLLATALNQGWWVLTTDYEGLDGHYVAGIESGRSTLDSVRVVLTEGQKIGLSPDVRYAMTGYSGGSLACGWAAELQPSYAPELDFAGAALGGTIANVSSALRLIHDVPFVGLAFQGINGLSKAYPNLTEWLDANLIPEKKDEFYHIASACSVPETAARAGGQDIFSYFVNGEDSISEDVPASVLESAALMGVHGTPTMPLFVYKAVKDEISAGEDTDELIDKYCDDGATIEYQRDLVGGHLTEAITGSASAFNWIAERLDGKTVDHEGLCIKRDVLLTELDKGTIAFFGKEVFTLLKVTLGGMLGK